MGITTLDISISSSDGWRPVAINPSFLIIKPHAFVPWFVAIMPSTIQGPSIPAATLKGLPYGRNVANRLEEFRLSYAITSSVVFIRTASVSENKPTEPVMFTILKEP